MSRIKPEEIKVTVQYSPDYQKRWTEAVIHAHERRRKATHNGICATADKAL